MQVSAGFAHTCAATAAGAAVCWGRNDAGQRTPPPDLGPVALVSAGHAFTCAVTRAAGDGAATDTGRAGRVRCWGDDRT